jgi:hypothetical protein
VKRSLPILAALVLLLGIAMPASAVKPIRDTPVRHVGTDYNQGQGLPFGQGEAHTAKPPLGPAKIGSVRTWLGLDDLLGSIYLKNYTLRALNDHVEVWVANNLNFPNQTMLNPLTSNPTDTFTYNDCRNDGVRNVVTDAQAQYLADQFNDNIYPTEAEWFDVPPNRNGSNALLPKLIPNIPSAEYKGEGDNVVVLVDNVRDDNFYDMNNVNTHTYIAGFYFSVFDDYFNRTVMSIDGFDWLHRTGADPLHQPTSDPCNSAPARPYLYEGVFAHEYQHLLHHYIDPNERTWVNEGMSDLAALVTGYFDPMKHVNQKGNDSHTNAFLGWLSVPHPDWNPIERASGPENGLTAWEDQGDDEILEDYGFAFYFMNLVNSQGYGQDFFKAWQHEAGNGIEGLETTLTGAGASDTFMSLFRDIVVSALADGYIDNGAAVNGDATAADLQNLHSEAAIYFSGNAYDTPGAPPWGSDYIDLGSGAALTSVAFDGADNYVPGPQWVVDPDGYFTNPDAAGTNEYAGNQDVNIARSVAGHDGEVLSFDHYYAMELGWDFGFVQVSTDEGVTWQSLACDGTTSDHNPGASGDIVEHVPGYTGPSDDPENTDTNGTATEPLHATCPALPAGSDYIAFRLMTDDLANFDGWHVKNVQVNDVDLGTPGSLAGWDNELFFLPVNLDFMLTIVGLNGTVDGFGDVGPSTGVQVLRPTLGASDEYTLTAGDFAALAGYAKVVAIVSGIPSAETISQYQPYSLLVNGVEKADGG